MHFVCSLGSTLGFLLPVILEHSRQKNPALGRKCQAILQLLLLLSPHFMTPFQEDFLILFSKFFHTALILINHLVNQVSLHHQRRLLDRFESPGLRLTSAIYLHARGERHLQERSVPLSWPSSPAFRLPFVPALEYLAIPLCEIFRRILNGCWIIIVH